MSHHDGHLEFSAFKLKYLCILPYDACKIDALMLSIIFFVSLQILMISIMFYDEFL